MNNAVTCRVGCHRYVEEYIHYNLGHCMTSARTYISMDMLNSSQKIKLIFWSKQIACGLCSSLVLGHEGMEHHQTNSTTHREKKKKILRKVWSF